MSQRYHSVPKDVKRRPRFGGKLTFREAIAIAAKPLSQKPLPSPIAIAKKNGMLTFDVPMFVRIIHWLKENSSVSSVSSVIFLLCIGV